MCVDQCLPRRRYMSWALSFISQHLLKVTMFSQFTEGETEAQRGQ